MGSGEAQETVYMTLGTGSGGCHHGEYGLVIPGAGSQGSGYKMGLIRQTVEL